MRGGKMNEVIRQSLIFLLKELKEFNITRQTGSIIYRLFVIFYDEHEADEFRKLLLIELGFTKIHEKINAYASRCYVIEITWYEHERDYLIENIERYLQEDNMGPTNVNRENTKFYAIVTDENGNKTAYEITHSSLETSMEWGCSGCYTNTNYTLRFEQGDMRECECVLTRWAKQCDEIDKLKAENEKLKVRLGNCENQLRNACEYLNGYGDTHIDIPTELKNLDYFSSVVNYRVQGENKRREFGKKVAEQVKILAEANGMWKRIATNAMQEVKSKEILEDAVEVAMNPFYVSSNTMKTADSNPFYIQNPAVLRKSIQLSLNSWYGLTAAGIDKVNNTKLTPIFNVYDSIKDVKFANPATIVFWKDGTKTVVMAQGDEQYVPEVGLAMCICKKVMGNTRDYYRVFKHWMKKV